MSTLRMSPPSSSRLGGVWISVILNWEQGLNVRIGDTMNEAVVHADTSALGICAFRRRLS